MENIQVALRIRPINKKELQFADENIWSIQENKTLTLQNQYYKEFIMSKKLNATTRTTYAFDYCFIPTQDNNDVYETVVKRVALSSLNGINGTVFMYGQTGSGKTYTMMGYDNEEDSEASRMESNTEPNMDRSPIKRNDSLVNDSGYPDDLDISQQTRIAENQLSMRKARMVDISQNTGILILALKDIFNNIENDLEKTYFLRCSYVEIYNDQVYDLLKNPDRLGETLVVNEDSKRDFYIKGVIEDSVSSISEILDKLKKGESNRHYAQTMMNHTSSRSHTIFRLMVQTMTNSFIRDYRAENKARTSNINNFELKSHFEDAFSRPTEAKGTVITESLLNFVDLAGSEKISNHHLVFEEGANANDQSGIYGKDSILAASRMKERVKEGQHINKSLFFLTQVISLKSEGKSNQHIPYRNSPLTKILRSSLGGNSRTLIILCATPAGSQMEQSLSTFRFGMNAKKIENKVHANIVSNDESEVFRILISDYERKVKELESSRHDDLSRFNNLLHKYEELQNQKAILIDKVNNLCKAQLNRMTQSIPQDELATFFKQARERFIHFDKVGILFSAKNIKKYEQHSKKSQKKSRGLATSCSRLSLDSNGSDNESERSDRFAADGRGSRVRDLYKSKPRDIIGAYSLASVKLSKQQVLLLQRKIASLLENFTELTTRHLDVYEKGLMTEEEKKMIKRVLEKWQGEYNKIMGKYQAEKDKYKGLALQYNKQLDIVADLTAQLALHKDMQGLDTLGDEQLKEMESHFWTKIDEIKNEKARRVVQREMGRSPIKEKTAESSLNKGKRMDEIDTTASSDEGERDIETDLHENNNSNALITEMKESLEEEAEIFKEIFRKGIQEIDDGLEQTRRVCTEMETAEHEKEIKEFAESRTRRLRDDTKKNDDGNKNKRQDVSKSSNAGSEYKLDLVESLADLKGEMEYSNIRSLSEVRAPSKSSLTSFRGRREKAKELMGGSIVIDGDDDTPLKKKPSMTKIGTDTDLDTKIKNMKVELARARAETSEEAPIQREKSLGAVPSKAKGAKTSREERSNTMNLKSILENYNQKDKEKQRQSLVAEKINSGPKKSVAESQKDPLKKINKLVKDEGGTLRAVSSEKVQYLKETINTRGSSSAKKEVPKAVESIGRPETAEVKAKNDGLRSTTMLHRVNSSPKKTVEKYSPMKKVEGKKSQENRLSLSKPSSRSASPKKKVDGHSSMLVNESEDLILEGENFSGERAQERDENNEQQSRISCFLSKDLAEEENKTNNLNITSQDVTMLTFNEEDREKVSRRCSMENMDKSGDVTQSANVSQIFGGDISTGPFRLFSSSVIEADRDLNTSEVNSAAGDESKARRSRAERKKKKLDE